MFDIHKLTASHADFGDEFEYEEEDLWISLKAFPYCCSMKVIECTEEEYLEEIPMETVEDAFTHMIRKAVGDSCNAILATALSEGLKEKIYLSLGFKILHRVVESRRTGQNFNLLMLDLSTSPEKEGNGETL